MINRQSLLSDLQKLLQKLEADLLDRSVSAEVPEVGVRLKEEHARATNAQRTAQNYEDWRTDAITQTAAAWVLSCVFVRFLEDNRLIDPPRISGPSDFEPRQPDFEPRPSGSGPPSTEPPLPDGRGSIRNRSTEPPLPDGRGSTRNRLGRARDEHELYFRKHPKQTDREYLLSIFDQLAKLPGTKDVFGEHNPIRELPNWLSGDAAGELLKFFQKIDANTGALIHDFACDTEPRPSGSGDASSHPDGRSSNELDTRFLGDLYQDLSEAARKKYALLQTPDFVEAFILDRTLEPALDEFGLEPIEPRPSGSGDASSLPNGRGSANTFKMIDPACGSGHFLLGSFPRILDRWMKKAPGTNVRELVQRTLDSIHGVDVNPFAIAIARFRLLLAALRACDIQRLADAPAFQMNLVCGDSLLHVPLKSGGKKFTKGQREFDSMVTDSESGGDVNHAYQSEDLQELKRIVRPGQYHAVVANPPYITPKDRALNEQYRNRFESCHMKYSLSVPFMEQLFRLAVSSNTEPRPSGSGNSSDEHTKPAGQGLTRSRAGFVGQITANSFMKREFGKKLIESFFPGVDLTHVIDTSGAYIPGHGTPTVILFGRNRAPVSGTLRTVMGIRGEPSTPADPAYGRVWSAITTLIDQPDFGADLSSGAATVRERMDSGATGGEPASSRARLEEHGQFVSVGDSQRALFHKHPWSIGGGGASELKEILEERAAAKLESRTDCIGFGAILGEDEAFGDPVGAPRLRVFSQANRRPVVEGDQVRDWSLGWRTEVLFPYNTKISLVPESDIAKPLWPLRTVLWERNDFSKKSYRNAGRAYWEYHQIPVERNCTPLSIVFAEVATHNHVVLDRGGKVFNRTAPVIKLRADATEDDHLALLGLLNSSTACFWMKQVCHNKGSTVDQHGARQRTAPFEDFYAFNGTKLQQFPLPADRPLHTTQLLDKLATRTGDFQPAAIASRQTPSRDALVTAKTAAHLLRSQMIATQEELDWECYRLYGLIADDLTYHPTLSSRDRQEAVTSMAGINDRSLTVAARGLELGQRAFEIVLARKMVAGETQTTWFERHGSTPITELPAEWPDDYRQLVERRIALIESDPNIRLIEQPEYKRRWNTEPWESQLERALREWLVNRLESYFDIDGRMHPADPAAPAPSSCARQEAVPTSLQKSASAHRQDAVSDAEADAIPAPFDEDWSGARLVVSKAEIEPQAYFVTFTCYGTWLHGDARGSIDIESNAWQTPPLEPDEERERQEFELLRHSPVKLESKQRLIVHRTVQEVCEYRGWRLHAVNVRTNHIHVVVTANRRGKRVLNDFKSYATRRMKEAGSLPAACLEVLNAPSSRARQEADNPDTAARNIPSSRAREEADKPDTAARNIPSSRAREEADKPEPEWTVWTRGGSARPILTENSFRRAIEYTLHEQGPEITHGIGSETPAKASVDEVILGGHGEREVAGGAGPLPHGRGSNVSYEVTYEVPYVEGVGSNATLVEISLYSIARLASVAGQDADFLQVGELYRDDAAFDVQALVTELVAPECVPLLPVLRYKPAGLIKRTTWERTWDLQRQEDEYSRQLAVVGGQLEKTEDAAEKGRLRAELDRLTAESTKLTASIPIPTKYDSKDFLGSDFWRLRGKLDVPKERWISFPHCDGPDGTLMLCWAGYDHLQQAQAISACYVQVQTELGGTADPRLIPLLAGLIELLPWLKQWHNELDPEFNMSMGDYFEGFINEEARQLGKTLQEIREWTPPAKTAARRSRRSK